MIQTALSFCTRKALGCLGLVAALGVASSAHATWSILIMDIRTGEIAVGSATCLTSFNLRDNTPVLLTGIGAGTAQSAVDNTGQNRVFIRDALLAGIDPVQIVADLESFDGAHQSRQYGIIDVMGGTATFSGSGAGSWAGGQTGHAGPIYYAVQGNVLAGSPVVENAVQAIINTPGDLPAKLMAAMEAARFFGGDGRCSCSGGAPDSCGSPPNNGNFNKSAHIAYMLVARTGDIDGCNSVYRTGNGSWWLRSHDINNDGKKDLVVSNPNGDTISLLINATNANSPFLFFDPAQSIPAGDGVRGLELADVTGDNIIDIITANTAADTVSVHAGQADGSFAPFVQFPVGDQPFAVTLADFDGVNGLDIACANRATNDVSILLNDGTGNFTLSQTVSGGTAPTRICSGDINDDGFPDLVTIVQFTNLAIPLLNDGTGNFLITAPLVLADRPNDIICTDLSGDGRDDIAITIPNANMLTIFKQIDPGFLQQDIQVFDQPQTLTTGDVDGDGNLDIVVTEGFSREFTVLSGDGVGNYVETGAYASGLGNSGVVLEDLNNNGSLDLAVTMRASRSIVLVANQGDGTFNNGIGCATGDYFMNFNIAFQSAAEPDPVFQLHDLFDQWRSDLADHPDALRSTAIMNLLRVPADGAAQSTLTITLKDWQNLPATVPTQLSVTHAPGSAGLSQIGPVTDLGNGQFSVIITAGNQTGTDLFSIIADDGVRPVTLMPEAQLVMMDSALDLNNDGIFDVLDFFHFIVLFVANDPAADLNGDGAIDVLDFFVLSNAF